MSKLQMYFSFFLLAAATSFFAGAQPQQTYYVDCSLTSAGSGTLNSPWDNLAAVNQQSYSPGDTILFKRGTTCHGTLAPHRSGTAERPIRISAYGKGRRPQIVAQPTSDAALRLFNQEYWEIDSLDLSHSHTFGVFVSGSKGVLHHIYLRNLSIHDVLGDGMKHKESGLLVISPGTTAQRFDDVLIDGVTAWNTTQWAGILVGGGDFGFPPPETWSTHVVIRNSTVHDVQGDGIVLFRVRQGSIENSVAWNTGMQVTETMGTPNAIWTWMCDQCTVSQNEAFLTDSPGVDGGAFDIDYGNTGNSVIDNYGHDTQGYCVAVFGAGFVTRQSVVRGNLCINNGRSPRMAKFQGAIFLHTWNGGSIDDLTVEKNVVQWSPFEAAPALINDAEVHGSAITFRDNTVDSTSPWLVDSKAALIASRNQYHYCGAGNPRWRFDGKTYTDLSAAQKSGQEPGSAFSSHLPERCPHSPSLQIEGARFDGSAVFGADWKSLDGQPHAWPADHLWRLYVELPGAAQRSGLLSEDALRQLVIVRSLAMQYRASGLRTMLLFTSPSGDLYDTLQDMNLGRMDVAVATAPSETPALRTILVAPNGNIAADFRNFAGTALLGKTLRGYLGTPAFSQMETYP